MTKRPGLVVLFTAAHPDDDVMGAVGLMALHRDDPDLRFVLVHATDGEQGEIAEGSGATRETLGQVRREEDRRSWEVVGRPPDRHEWLALPDGGLADLHAELTRRLTEIMADERPDVVLTFGPDGITGHPDHIAVGAATTDAFHTLRTTPGPGFRRLFHGAFPQPALDRDNAERVRRGLKPWDPTKVYEPRGVPEEFIDCTVDQTEVVDLVRLAFREHRSQWAPPWSDLEDHEWHYSAGKSHCVQAWPPRERGLPRLADPLEGLDR
jgi:LmbE family N-acetylglucosaminyl deacetylase